MNDAAEIKELHVRQYSIYDSQKEQEEALSELHELNYQIFDENGSALLKEEFHEEFDKVAHDISFVSMLEKAKSFYLFNPHRLKKLVPEQKSASDILDDKVLRKKALANIMASLLIITNGEPKIHHKALDAYNGDCAHKFYINKKAQGAWTYLAHGYYNINNNQFIIGKGSYISETVSPSYMKSKSNLQRMMFIRNYCEYNLFGCYVKEDAPCSSPSAAASFVTGRLANGWVEWKDEQGTTLNEFFKSE